MQIERFPTPGLGDHTYLLAHDGLGVVIDPQRDIERFRDAAAAANVEVRAVVETHLHNDYVSGGPQLALHAGADLVLPAAAGATYRYRPAFHGEAIELGSDLTLLPWHTPGHTPEHTSYVVLIGGEPVAVFTGGSLLVGSAGRTDLLGEQRADQLARLQHGSLQRLAGLPGGVGVYPTHGEGSFCAATGADRTVSDIDTERSLNPALAHDDPDGFARWQRQGLQPYPAYYARMGPANLAGGGPMPDPATPTLDVDAIDRLADRVELIDIRERHDAAEGHIPGSHLVSLGEDFGVWAGWLIDLDAPVALVADAGDDVTDAVVQLGRIGIDDVRGVLPIDAWRRAGRPLASMKTASVDEVAGAISTESTDRVLDVRSPGEAAAEGLPGAVHRYVPDLAGDAGRWLPLDPEPYVVCASGRRAAIAAGLLARRGYRPVAVLDGGVAEVLAARPSQPGT